MITGKNYIGNELSGKSNSTFRTFNPEANVENLSLFYEASKEELNTAVEKATAAFPDFKEKSGVERAKFLEAIAVEIEALGEILIETYIQESGLPRGRAEGERGRTLGQLRAFAKMLEEGSWVEAIITRAEGKPDLRRMLVPIGPIAVFGASNFPLAFSTAGGDTASALAAGCPVVVKSHPMHAGTGELVASAIIKAAQKTEMPEGVFSNLNSKGIEVGEWLVMHPQIKAAGFTGSIQAGTALYRLAASREEPIPVFAEMGSVNPVVALPSSLREKAAYWAKQYAASITAGAGQFCTNPGLILAIDDSNLEVFLKRLGKELKAVQPSCMLHPKIRSRYVQSKAEVLANNDFTEVGDYSEEVAPNYAQQSVISVPASTFLKSKVFQQEVFGPFSVVVKCEDANQLNVVLQSLEGQLTGTVLSADEAELQSFEKVIATLKSRVGRLIFNGVPTGVEVSAAMTHGGPFPATTDSKFTSVGLTAVKRWVRPVSYQDWPEGYLPKELQDENPLKIIRTLNGEVTARTITNG